MSYCRFYDADAYIFRNAGGGFECCACSFKPHSFRMLSIFGLLLHCLKHSFYHDMIPSRAYKRIFYEIVTLQWFNFDSSKKAR